MDPKAAAWLQDIPAEAQAKIAEAMGKSVGDLERDEGLASVAWGDYWLMMEAENGGPSTDPGYARYIASQTMNLDGS